MTRLCLVLGILAVTLFAPSAGAGETGWDYAVP